MMTYLLWFFILILCMVVFLGGKHLKPFYVYMEEDSCTKKKIANRRVMFLRGSDSFSKMDDAKRLTTGVPESGFDEAFLSNAAKQEKMNHSERVQAFLRKQRRKERKIELIQSIKKITVRDIIVWLIYVVLPFIAVKVLQLPCMQVYCANVIGKIADYRVDLLLAQLSLTFITISVMSIFSDGNAVIYWQNIVKQTLIDPPASCFKAYFWYSFFYLLMSMISVIFVCDVGIGVFFIFNIICLFDLSRTMINCYYNPNAKKRKLVKQFIEKIEKANVAVFENNKIDVDADARSLNEQCIEEVRATFDDFNYYTNEAYSNQKYNILKENLAVYGKLLSHVHSATIDVEEFPLLDWYDKKTYKAYREVVKNYYEECYSMLLGYVYSNAVPLGQSMERMLMDKILVVLANDVPNAHEVNYCYELILYKFYVNVLAIARVADYENLENYIIPLDRNTNGLRLSKNEKEIGKMLQFLCKWCNEDIKWYTKEDDTEKGNTEEGSPEKVLQSIDSQKLDESLKQHKFIDAIAELIGNVLLINTKDVSILRFDWIPWEELGRKKCEVIKAVIAHVERNSETFSVDRKKQCRKRIKYVEWAIPEEFLVRRVTEQDVDAVLVLYNSNQEFYHKYPPMPTRESLLEDIKDNSYRGVYVDDKLIGILQLMKEESEENTVRIPFFMLHNNYQGRGIGTAFLEQILNNLSENGYEQVRIAVNREQLKQREFWTYLGFKMDETNDTKKNVVELILSLDERCYNKK